MVIVMKELIQSSNEPQLRYIFDNLNVFFIERVELYDFGYIYFGDKKFKGKPN